MTHTCVVFDLDETLISTTKRQFQVIKDFFESKEIDWHFHYEEYIRTRKITKKSNLDIFRFLNSKKLNEKEFQIFFSKNIESIDYLFLDELIINLELLKKIKCENGIKLILLSLRSNRENSMKQLKNIFLYNFLDEIYFEKHSRHVNPKTNRLNEIKKKYGEIMFIGDSLSDLEAANETRIEFVKVDTGIMDFNFSGESFSNINLLIKSKYGI